MDPINDLIIDLNQEVFDDEMGHINPRVDLPRAPVRRRLEFPENRRRMRVQIRGFNYISARVWVHVQENGGRTYETVIDLTNN